MPDNCESAEARSRQIGQRFRVASSQSGFEVALSPIPGRIRAHFSCLTNTLAARPRKPTGPVFK